MVDKYHKRSSNWCYFEGKGRYWRFCEIDNKVHLQMGETKDTFDRWANSVEKTVPFNCKTHKEFKELLIQMIKPGNIQLMLPGLLYV